MTDMTDVQVVTMWIMAMLMPAIFIPLARVAYKRNSLWGWWPASYMAGGSLVLLMYVTGVSILLPQPVPLVLWLFVAIAGHRQIKLRRKLNEN